MANWGASASISAAADSTYYANDSTYTNVVDNFTALQAPHAVNTSVLANRVSIDTSANFAVAFTAPFSSSVATSTTYRAASTYTPAVRASYVAINRRPNRGQVYPRF